MELFGVGIPEVGLIFVIALIVLGPERFPEVARQAGRWYRTARAFTDTVMQDVRSAVDQIEDEVGVERGTLPIGGLTGAGGRLADVLRETGERAAAAAPPGPETGIHPNARADDESTSPARIPLLPPPAPSATNDETHR